MSFVFIFKIDLIENLSFFKYKDKIYIILFIVFLPNINTTLIFKVFYFQMCPNQRAQQKKYLSLNFSKNPIKIKKI